MRWRGEKGKEERNNVREGDETGEEKGRQVVEKKRRWRTEDDGRMTEGGSGGVEEKDGSGRKKKIIIIRRKVVQAEAVACLPPASPSPVGCVGEWGRKRGGSV